MKKIKSFFMMLMVMTLMLSGTISVSAASAELSSLKIYAVDSAGQKTQVPINFKSSVYDYNIQVKSDAVSLKPEFVTVDPGSKAQILREQYNLKLDTGSNNKTQIQVTATDKTVVTYTINTTKLTPKESESFEYGMTPASGTVSDKNATKVTLGKQTFKISKTLGEKVPKGFEKSSYEYKGKKYECIVKGDAEHLVALYLYNSKSKGFYVYRQSQDTFYKLQNINIASRMYTIVAVDDEAEVLKNYEQEQIKIGDETVKAWVLDEEEDLYLVYAMNWDEEVSLYCYDSREEVFQRYPISENAFAQKEAAEVAYTNLQTNRNQLAHKYNRLLKIVGGLIILIIILLFVIVNMKIAGKSKKLKKKVNQNRDFDIETMEDIHSAENDRIPYDLESDLKATLETMLPPEEDEISQEDEISEEDEISKEGEISKEDETSGEDDFEFIDLD